MPCTRRKQLVKQMLENIRADALESHIHIISHYARHRQGVYVLYHNENLYTTLAWPKTSRGDCNSICGIAITTGGINFPSI